MGCITPGSMGGGQAVSLSHSTGFGGSPGSTTIKFDAGSGDVTAPSLSLSSPMSVGSGGKVRQMVPIRYSLDQSPGSSSMSVTFQDYLPLKLSRMFIALNDPDVNIPSGPCVKAIGSIHHKPAGAPSAVDETTVVPGPAPKIREGNSWKKLGEEYIFYNSNELAGAAGGFIGPSLSGVISGAGSLMNQTGSLLSIIQGIASDQGVELYSDDQGRIEVKPKGGGAGGGVGPCEIISKSSSNDIGCTSAKGGYAIYKHKDQWRRKTFQFFRSIDLLGIPFDNCNGDEVNLYEKDMTDAYRTDLERALKIGFLDKTWENWQGYMTYVYLKRSSSGAEGGAPEDSCPIIKYSYHDKKKHGQNIPPKKSIKDCVEVADLPLKQNDDSGPNAVIDKIYGCMKPLVVDIDDLADDIKANFETNFGKGDVKGVIDKIPGNLIQYFALEGYKKLKCVGEEIEEDGSGTEADVGANVAQGSLAEFSSALSELAATIGRYWVMSGGGQGGGGGQITERQHNLRKYEMESGGRMVWYHPDLDVRETIFSGVYLALYEKKMQGQGGHLSVGQFLALASKNKRLAMGGKGGAKTPRPKGKSSTEIAAAAADLAKFCNNNEPKGILIWDREFDKIALPEQVDAFKYIGAGSELHNDRYSNDIVRYIFEQVKTSVLANPCKGNGKPEEGKADCVDGQLDAYKPHEEWRVAKRRSQRLNYSVLEDRSYYASRAQYPPCDEAMSINIGFEDLSGKVLWRNVDCYGNVQEWTHPFMQGGVVQSALARAVSKMYSTETEPCGSTTTTTCGSGMANIPGGGRTQDYSVQIGDDGSITTSFTTGNAESSLAGSNIASHKGGPGAPIPAGNSTFVQSPAPPPAGRGFRNQT